MVEYSLASDECVYVGDETRDVEAARKAGMRSAAVTWGFNSRELLEKSRPDFLIDRPGELLECFG
jgi:phosphoglycolate phosphatase